MADLPERTESRDALYAGKFLDWRGKYYRLKTGSCTELVGYLAHTRHITAWTSAWEGR